MSSKKTNKLSFIFSILASIGVVGTSVLAVKNSKKAEKLKNNPDATKKDELMCYIPATVCGAGTIGLIFLSHGVNKKQIAALASGMAVMAERYDNYRSVVKEELGPSVDQHIIETISIEEAKKQSVSAPCLIGNAALDITDIHEQKLIFYDNISNRFFESTIGNVLQAEYHINRNFSLGACPSINDFYELLGIDKVNWGDDIGWGFNMWNDGINWIDFTHYKSTKEENGEFDYYILDSPFGPDPKYLDDFD